MKKIVLSVVAVMTFTLGFAETGMNRSWRMDRQPVNYDMSFDLHRLAAKLELTQEQMETVQVIQDCFNDEVLEASASRGLARRHQIYKAVGKDLYQMHRVLDEKQFSTYRMLLGATLKNKGL